MQCRSCSSNIISIIALGDMPLANALLKESDSKEERYNLEVMQCSECGLAQLKDIIDPAVLFTDYVYFSSNSEGMLKSASKLVETIAPDLKKESLVVEIASNDGYLLKYYIQKGIQVLGIDPAQNIAKIANEQGVRTLCDFFSEGLALDLATKGQLADVIHANNVMAHVPNLNGFIKGLKVLLKPEGMCVIEVPYFLDLVQHLEFDTIYHEHVYYFSVKPLREAFARHELEIFNIEKISIHGGSLRIFIAHRGAKDISPNIQAMINHEIESGLYNYESFSQFMNKIMLLKQQLKEILSNLKKEGKKIAAYGASAKGTTLLNYFGINSDLLDFVVDRSEVKQGFYTPGSHLKVKAPLALIHEKVDYALLLVWNFVDEILLQQKPFTDQSGKFILPLPTVRVLE